MPHVTIFISQSLEKFMTAGKETEIYTNLNHTCSYFDIYLSMSLENLFSALKETELYTNVNNNCRNFKKKIYQ